MKNNPKVTSQRSWASEPCMWDYGCRFSPPWSKDEELEALRGPEPHPWTEQEGQSRLRGPVGPRLRALTRGATHTFVTTSAVAGTTKDTPCLLFCVEGVFDRTLIACVECQSVWKERIPVGP